MKSNKILFILNILWGCFACTDGLEVIPENSVTFENYFKTEKDIETSLNALRDEFRSTCAFNANKTPIDLGFVHDTLRSTSAQKSFNWDATQFTPIYVDFFWNSHYAIICYANILLENIDKAEITQNRKDYYISTVDSPISALPKNGERLLYRLTAEIFLKKRNHPLPIYYNSL